MIKRITRKKLDVNQYTECLNRSVNYRIYAEVLYLDALVGENWDCYVLNDYEAIMPLPFVKKFGLKFIVQPTYCQQLGVFHQENFSKETFQLFEKKLHRNLVRAYSFNEENTTLFVPKGEKRVNQILDISKEYTSIYQEFNSNRKRNISKNNFNHLLVKKDEIQLEWFIKTLKEHYTYSQTINLVVFEQLIKSLSLKKKISIYSLHLENNSEAISSALIRHSKNRRILINSVRNKTEEPQGSFSYLLANIIKENSNQNLIFDFEGSNIAGIQQYYASYNSIIQHYHYFSNLKFIENIAKKFSI